MDTLKREVLAQRVLRVKPSGIRKFFDIINTMPDVISLGIGEPDFVTPEHIRQANSPALTPFTLSTGRCWAASSMRSS